MKHEIYLNKIQYNLLAIWVQRTPNVKDEIRRDVIDAITTTGEGRTYATCRFSKKIERLMILRCPFKFILDRLEEKYDKPIEELRENINKI